MGVIYIAGITQRSGTNWLYELIAKHPGCSRALGWEDHFVFHADQLNAYARNLRSSWKDDWPLHRRNADAAVLRQFGEGLKRVLACSNKEAGPCEGRSTTGGRLLTKTPAVKNIDQFFTFFPDSHLIILVRDGRSVVESGMRTFQWPFEQAVHRWREAARTILEFDKHEDHGSYHLIRYEDLFRNTVDQLKELFEFLELDPSIYEFESALDAPVKGSSTYGQDEGGVDWKPVEKGEGFSPLERWEDWTAARHDRFNWVAGQELRTFGYSPVSPYSPVVSRIRRGYWGFSESLSQGVHRIRRSIGRRILP